MVKEGEHIKKMIEIEKRKRPGILDLAKTLERPRLPKEELEKITLEAEKRAPIFQPEKPKKEFSLRGVLREILSKKPELGPKLPKFYVSEPKHILVIPKIEDMTKVDIRYPLIEPFAYARIQYDEERNELVYELDEPDLTDYEKSLYDKIIKNLTEIVDVQLSSVKNPDEAIRYVEEQVKKILVAFSISINPEDYIKIMYYIYRNFVGLNEIEPLMRDPLIEDIGLDGLDVPIYIVHRKFGSIKTNIIFSDLEYLKDFVVKLSERCGRYISYAEPLLDGALPGGSRIQASLAADVTTRGPTFSIRKFIEKPLSPVDILDLGTASAELLAYLWLAVESGACILVCGGTATGKTTFLNVLSMFIPVESRIISIEDTRELALPHENWIPSVARRGFGIPTAEGRYGEVTMFDLLKESFRQNPDYVIVGEVRGAEAYVLFQGMASGHSSFGTMHAGRVEDLIHRLETPPIELPSSLIETLDMVIMMVHARERGKAARRVKEIIEIESVDPKTGAARTNKIFSWLPTTDSFEYRGYSWLMQKISKLKGVSLDELQRELIRRKKVLEWMHKEGIKDYKQVAETFAEYKRRSPKLLKAAGVK